LLKTLTNLWINSVQNELDSSIKKMACVPFMKKCYGFLDKIMILLIRKDFKISSLPSLCELQFLESFSPSRLIERPFSPWNYNILSTKTDKRIRERCHDFARSLFFSRYTRPRKRVRGQWCVPKHNALHSRRAVALPLRYARIFPKLMLMSWRYFVVENGRTRSN